MDQFTHTVDDNRHLALAALEAANRGAIGLGLRSMRERLSFFDGTLEVETAPGNGTRVTISVPCR